MLRSETILQSISDAIFTVDRHWRFTYLNPQAEKLLLKSSQELLGKVVWEEFPEARGTTFYTNYHLALEEQRKVSFEEFYPPLQTWFDVTAYPSKDGLSVYFRDISKRKEVEQAFQEQLRLANLVADISQALVLGDSLQAILHNCTEALISHLKVAFARIWTFNPAENMLELQASSGEYTHLNGPHGRVPLGSFKIGRIAQERQPHLTNSVIGDGLVSDQEWAKREKMVAFAGYPLLLEDRLLGVLAIFSHEPISESTYRVLETLIKQLSLGIERKLTEISLREQRENYAVTLASIGDAVIATDSQGRVTYLNAVAEDLTAWRTADALGQPLTAIFNIVNMTTRLPVENPVSKVLKLGIVVGLANHTVLLARDGREISIDDSAAPIKNASNQIIGVVLVFRDATERLAAEEERHQLLLREQNARREAEKSHNHLYDLFMQAPASIAVLVGPKHTFSFANPQYMRLVGRVSGIIGLDVRKALPEIEGQGFYDLLDQVYLTGQPFYGNETPVKLDRLGNGELEEVYLNFVYQPYKDLAGQVEGIVVHAVEVTEQVLDRQRVERLLEQLAAQQAQLQANNKRLKFLSEASAILASSLDYNLTLRKVAELLVPSLADFCYFDILNNEGKLERVAWQGLELSRNELLEGISTYAPMLERGNHPVTQVIASGQAKLVAEVDEQWLEKVTVNREHFELARQVGIISYLAVPLTLRGQTYGAISLCFTRASGRHYTEDDQELILELTRRASLAIDNARLYHATQKALKERETFLSVAAHELKTPLTGLKGFTQVLNRQLESDGSQSLDPAKVKRTLGIINKQSDKLTYLIDQLLDVSRIETGKLLLDLRPTEVVNLVIELVEHAQSRTSRHALTFNSSVEKLVARIDPVRYEQVVNNLVDNAIKYSPEGGAITLSLSCPDGAQTGFSLSVTDQGLGIPVERRPHIFERFYQAHETTLITGMGLGLYICRQIIQLHGGEIWAEFPDEGGTRFIVTVPLVS